jgi:hypothetical protein
LSAAFPVEEYLGQGLPEAEPNRHPIVLQPQVEVLPLALQEHSRFFSEVLLFAVQGSTR